MQLLLLLLGRILTGNVNPDCQWMLLRLVIIQCFVFCVGILYYSIIQRGKVVSFKNRCHRSHSLMSSRCQTAIWIMC